MTIKIVGPKGFVKKLKTRKERNLFPRAFLMAGHKRKPPKKKCILGDRCQGCNRCLPPLVVAKAVGDLVVASAHFFEGSNATCFTRLSLTETERDHVLTMIDFFDSCGEDQALDPKVLAALREKLGERKRPTVERLLDRAEEVAQAQADVCGEPDSQPAELLGLLRQLRCALEEKA